MAEDKTYHIGADGIARLCTADSPEKCRVKGPDGRKSKHYSSPEHAYEATYVKNSHSIKAAKEYMKKYEDASIDDDPVIRRIIKAGMQKRKHTREITMGENRNPEVMPVKAIRPTGLLKEQLKQDMSDYDVTIDKLRELGKTDRMGAMACAYSSYYNASAELDSLQNELKRRMDEEPFHIGGTLGSVVYEATDSNGEKYGFYTEQRMTFDEKGIESDIMSNCLEDVSLDDYKNASDSINVTNAVKIIESVGAEEMHLKKGQRGAPALRKAWADRTGLYTEETMYEPDKQSIADIAGKHPDSVVGERTYSDTELQSMSDAELRARIAHQGLKANRLKGIVIHGVHDYKESNEQSFGDSEAGFKMDTDGIKWKATTKRTLDDEKFKAWADERGISKDRYTSTRRTLTREGVKRLYAEHPELGDSYLRYATVSQSIGFRNFSNNTTATMKTRFSGRLRNRLH